MADVVIGIAASHAPNLANPSMITGVKEEQYDRVKAGFAQARTLLEQARPGLVKIGDIGRVFLVLTLTAFVPGACSFPGSAWERQGRAALPLQERPQAEPAKQGVPGQSPGTRAGQDQHRSWRREQNQDQLPLSALPNFHHSRPGLMRS